MGGFKMNLLTLILWIIIGVMNFIHFGIDIKKGNNELKDYFWQYLAWFMVMVSLIPNVI